MPKRFPYHAQLDAMDCGPAALRMVCSHLGRAIPQTVIRDLCGIGRSGVNLQGMAEAAEKLGLRAIPVRLTFQRLRDQAPLPCIAHWEGDHFVVVYAITSRKVRVADPAAGLIDYTHGEFLRATAPAETPETDDAPGIYLLLETTPAFHEIADSGGRELTGRRGFGFFFGYLRPHYRLMGQVILAMLVGLGIELILPFLAQALVDQGIGQIDLQFIYVLLGAQIALSVSQTMADMIRSWLLLHIGSRVSVAMIADFLGKLLRLPLAFFDSRSPGDITQRIDDHQRVKNFLMSSSLDIVFSLLTFVVFAFVLAVYSWLILGVFLFFSILSVGWLLIFLKKRRELDHKRFALEAKERDVLFEVVQAMPEIKIHGLQRERRTAWERLAIDEYRLDAKSLWLYQAQRIGVMLASNLRNVLISFVAARAVISGEMTLGMMLATQYIVGQLNSPISRLIDFVHTGQDARLSLERMQEISTHADEEDEGIARKNFAIPSGTALRLIDLTFRYPGAGQPDVLHNVDLNIPVGKITAIVGSSGSGKTTLLKLLLGLYPPTNGEIRLDDIPLAAWSGADWRARCGVVMQDGYIFNASIARNIAPGDQAIDPVRLNQALQFANLGEFVSTLANGVRSPVGTEGQGLSGGQRQRILLARAIYRNPQFLFLDEATSALDASNETLVLGHLREFARERTVVVIAHRLSTVRHADQIVVLDGGSVAETGTHHELLARTGPYHRLVSDQL